MQNKISRFIKIFSVCGFVGLSFLSSPAKTNFVVFQNSRVDIDTNRIPKNKKNSPIELKTPSNISQNYEYDYRQGGYIRQTNIGNVKIGHDELVDFQEYNRSQQEDEIRGYWKENLNQLYSLDGDNQDQNSGLEKYLNPKIKVNLQGFDRIFGTNVIDIHPQGNITISAGVDINKIDNFTLAKKQRNDVSFDFDMRMQVGVQGKIGDKMKVGINYNTEATFEFENEQKVEYVGYDDEIIQRIEFGNVSMPLEGTLISGSTTLFGMKTDLKFGNLSVSAVVSQQKGETKTISVDAGSVSQEFEISGSEYESNRHFFLSHYFRDNYEKALENLPVVNSGITITNIEVWITNDNLQTQNTRDVVAFLDLGDDAKYAVNQKAVHNSPNKNWICDNDANNLYENLINVYKSIRDINKVSSTLGAKFTSGTDYEKISHARKLNANEFSFNPTLGYISLNQTIKDDQSLAVAYQFTFKGKTYKVGEFSTDIKSDEAIIVKLIKGTSFSPSLPSWDLMMKNVYSLNAYKLQKEDFELQIRYKNDKTGIAQNYIPAGDISNQMLIKALNLDNVNGQNEAFPDGKFDFIEGITVNSEKGRIFIPCLEPFGRNLKEKINNSADEQKYCYPSLYDSTKTVAKQMAERDKFIISGKYRSSSGSEISLDAMNIEEGSVSVTCAGVKLTEGADYVVDYLLGTVKIVNESILNSGNQIQVSVESNTTFNSTTKTMLGTHFNYKFSDNFNVGATWMRLSEKTTTNKVNIGEEPIKNNIWGLDARYSTPLPFLTALVDKLPLINTKAESKLNLEGEFAQLVPGHSKSVDKNGTCYIDDFESAQSKIDIKSTTLWKLASTPGGQKRFKEASLNNDLRYGYNRAKIAWYNILSDLQGTGISSSGIAPSYITKDDQSNHYVRAVYEKEIFPNAQHVNGISSQLSILNLAYYPQEKGPYNYDVDGINSDGSLKNPSSRWGGIMRELTTTDFEASNVEYIEFWMMDPFIYQKEGMGGDIYFNLGDVSEDILKDSRKSFENGIPFPMDSSFIDTTAWGIVSNKTFLVNAFDNISGAKEMQDVGFDGLNDEQERDFFSDYLQQIKNLFGENSKAYIDAYNDPSGDNYHYFRGSDYDEKKLSILERYKNYNGPQGNSSDLEVNSQYSTIKDRYPDVEDINLDNTLSETESYYQYRVHLDPNQMEVGKNYITDVIESNVKLVNGQTENIRWYQFKVPVLEPDSIVGSISDFKSIKFCRMFLTGFEKEIVLRFAELNLVRGQWRKYTQSLNSVGEISTNTQITDGVLDLSTVSLEENGNKTPVNYLLPPGIERERDYQTNQVIEQDEQSLAMQITDLCDGQAVAAYKTAVLDLRQYKKLKMFVHAEQSPNQILNDNDLCIFVRLGSDYKENYYEYELPLVVTPEGYYADSDQGRLAVWPHENNVEIIFDELQMVKQQRNNLSREHNSSVSTSLPYSVERADNSRITIMGNPNVSNVRTIMIGVRNRSQEDNPIYDDGMQKSAQIWVNELRLTDFDEDGGWAARAKANLQIADIAEVTLSGYMHTPGFGSLEKKVSERYQDKVYQYDLTTQLQLGKFFNQKYGVQMPLYFGISENYEIPKYNPVDPDIELDLALKDPLLSKDEKKELMDQSINYEKRKSINITNLHIEGRSQDQKELDKQAKLEKKSPEANSTNQNTQQENKTSKPKNTNKQKPLYHVSNFTGSFAYTEYLMHNIDIKSQLERSVDAALEYNYTYNPKNYQPFSKIGFLQSKPFAIIKDFNFYLLPTMLNAQAQVARDYSVVEYRALSKNDIALEPVYSKEFLWNRNYAFRYKLSKGLSFDFVANNKSRVNPDGRLDRFDIENDIQKKDTLFYRFHDLGYNTDYNHTMKFDWNTPINKLPLLDWTNLRATYNVEYNWERGVDPIEVKATDEHPAYTIDYGNNISNSAILTLNGQLNFERLYQKVPYFKTVMKRFTKDGRKTQTKEKKEVFFNKTNLYFRKNTAKYIAHKLNTKEITVVIKDINGNPIDGKIDIIDPNHIKITTEENLNKASIEIKGQKPLSDSPMQIISDYTLMTLFSLRNLNFTYKNQRGNSLYGYVPQTKICGMEKFNALFAPGFDYIFGLNGEDFHEQCAQNNFLVKDSTLNQPVVYLKGNSFSIRAQVEPINTFKIDVSLDRSILFNTQNYYLYDNSIDYWNNLSTIKTGNYRISYNMLPTTFRSLGKDYSLSTYQEFLDYREDLAMRYAALRDGIMDYSSSKKTDEGYPDGYSSTHQDVLLTAFLAAYGGRNPNKIETSPFLKFPLPNWRISYKGLSNISFLKNLVRQAVLTHAYSCFYNVSSFKNNADYNFVQEQNYGYSFERYKTNNLFIPRFELSGVSIEEKFAPLIGIDISWVNLMSTKFEYRKTRQITLGFANSQISELYHKEYIIGFGYKFAQLPIHIRTSSQHQSFKSDLDTRVDFVINDDKTILREIEQMYNEISQGQRSYSLKATADYQLTKRFKMQLYYNQNITNPLISTAYRSTNVKFGVSMTMSLD